MSLWTRISEKEEKALRIEMSKAHWKLKVDQIKYKQMIGNDFIPTLQWSDEDSDEEEKKNNETKEDDVISIVQHGNLSNDEEKIGRQYAESDLLPEDEACGACGSRLKSKYWRGRFCCSCYRNKHRRINTVLVCDGPPQIKNNHRPLWSASVVLVCCRRCKLVALGETEMIDNTLPPSCTQTGGYAHFQDLGNLNLLSLFPKDSQATTGAVIVRVMDFSIETERVFGNFLVRFSRDDPRITNSYFFNQIVKREIHRVINARVINIMNYNFQFEQERLAEGQFILSFLLAQMNNWSFKTFRPPYPATVQKDKYWPDLKFGDKPIRLINRYVIGSNYSKSEFDELCHIPKVLFQTDMKLHYEWDMDPLKY